MTAEKSPQLRAFFLTLQNALSNEVESGQEVVRLVIDQTSGGVRVTILIKTGFGDWRGGLKAQ